MSHSCNRDREQIAITLKRGELRELSNKDPIAYPERDQKSVPKTVQVGTGDGRERSSWAAKDFDYVNNGWKGPLVASEKVSEEERMDPQLEVGGKHLKRHRASLRSLTDDR